MKKVLLILIIVPVIIFILDLFGSKTYSFSKLEIDRNVTRQEYYGDGLGRIYKNRLGVTFFNGIYPRLNKFQTKFFSDLSSGFIFILFYTLLVILGLRKFNEK
jgi:hypothetical protein